MTKSSAVVTKAEAVGQSTTDEASGFSWVSLLFLSAWSGLIGGLLEVATIVVRNELFELDQIYRLSRHFIWMIPLVNLALVLTLGSLGCGVTWVWRVPGRRLLARVLGALVLLPAFLVALPRIYALAWFVVTLGMATPLVPLLERPSRGSRRVLLVSFAVATGMVAILAGSLWLGDLTKQRRENTRSLPPPGSPNVLLIVMDTVAAGHLGLYGYDRPTSTTLAELAGRGILFGSARATSSWTLPSHASMFTGRWLHELSVGWVTPLDATHPTLAEFLGERGYATAGFVANTGYCAADTGLGRGFTRYQDYIFPELTALKTAVLASRALDGLRTAIYFLHDRLESAGLLTYVDRLLRALDDDRKGAAVVNRELLGWLSDRAQPERPFFAFLNYNDAHYPYELPPGRPHRFGAEPTEDDQRYLIGHWGDLDKTSVAPAGVAFAAASYDECIADLDEQIGKLIDQLDKRGDLEHTWLIITSDHGESFGEHPGYFGHGSSLYDTELHVPFLVIPPGGSATKQTFKEPVSLRDVAATIVDVAGQQAGAPFPGVSLARFWKPRGPEAVARHPSVSESLAEVVPEPRNHKDRDLRRQRFPQAAVKDSEWSYIRREGDDRDKLFHLREDPNEQNDRAGDPSAQTMLERKRAELERLTGGALAPGRFGQ
jgi:arylsulfatase A-like enzyme